LTTHLITPGKTFLIEPSGNPPHWSVSYIESLRSAIGIAAVPTAIEYEYRFTEYRFTEHEHDEIQCYARTHAL
jgi:hypothetical protein